MGHMTSGSLAANGRVDLHLMFAVSGGTLHRQPRQAKQGAGPC